MRGKNEERTSGRSPAPPGRLPGLRKRIAALDTLTIARNLTDAGADPKLAEATAARDHVTPDQFKARLAQLGARIAKAETRLTWRMLGIAGLVLAVMRLLS